MAGCWRAFSPSTRPRMSYTDPSTRTLFLIGLQSLPDGGLRVIPNGLRCNLF